MPSGKRSRCSIRVSTGETLAFARAASQRPCSSSRSRLAGRRWPLRWSCNGPPATAPASPSARPGGRPGLRGSRISPVPRASSPKCCSSTRALGSSRPSLHAHQPCLDGAPARSPRQLPRGSQARSAGIHPPGQRHWPGLRLLARAEAERQVADLPTALASAAAAIAVLDTATLEGSRAAVAHGVPGSAPGLFRHLHRSGDGTARPQSRRRP